MTHELSQVAPVEDEQAQSIDLADVRQLVAEQPFERRRRRFRVEVNTTSEGDGDDIAHQPRTEPPGVADAYFRTAVGNRIGDGSRQVHIIAVMRRLYRFVVLIAALPLLAQDFSNVEVKATKVAGTVYMLTGAGGNIGVSVGDDGIVIVDDQYAPLAPKIEAALKTISDKPVRFILNTHYHRDHTGGNEHLGKSAPIVAQENVRKRLKEGTTRMPAQPKGALPIVTFNDTLTIHLNGEDVRAVHFPNAHTDGDSVIWFTQSNVVHMGDNFFNGLFPVIDLDSGGGVKGMIRTIEKVASMIPADTKVIAGHGPLGDRDSLRKFGEVLKGTSAAIQTAIDAGKTVEQMKTEKIFGAWEDWGKGFVKTDQFIELLHRDLTRK
jgi:cyclase